MKISGKQIHHFRRKIFSWWEVHKRDLPWRKTRDPYKIFISEVMLQQTQVSRVLPKYDEFLYIFPDVYALARASTAKILRVWKGMGYNRRAIYLKRTAREIVDTHYGEFPDSEQELTKLPGLGTYTARAILVFAFEKNVAMVDTNIRQIINHFFFRDLPQKDTVIQDVADQLVPLNRSWEWHQALMDYGALELQPRPKQRDTSKKLIPFRESNRFYRGKIIDRLRESSVNEERLRRDFITEYHTTTELFDGIVKSLIKDGLVVRTEKLLQLPK